MRLNQQRRPPSRRLSPGDVDFLGPLRRVSQHNDLAIAHLDEAAADGKALLPLASPHRELARLQRCEERCVVRQDADLPIDRWRDDPVAHAIVYDTLVRDDYNVQAGPPAAARSLALSRLSLEQAGIHARLHARPP